MQGEVVTPDRDQQRRRGFESGDGLCSEHALVGNAHGMDQVRLAPVNTTSRSLFAEREMVRGPAHCRIFCRRPSVRAPHSPLAGLFPLADEVFAPLKATGVRSSPARPGMGPQANVEARWTSCPLSIHQRIQLRAIGERPSATNSNFISFPLQLEYTTARWRVS